MKYYRKYSLWLIYFDMSCNRQKIAKKLPWVRLPKITNKKVFHISVRRTRPGYNIELQYTTQQTCLLRLSTIFCLMQDTLSLFVQRSMRVTIRFNTKVSFSSLVYLLSLTVCMAFLRGLYLMRARVYCEFSRTWTTFIGHNGFEFSKHHGKQRGAAVGTYFVRRLSWRG